MTDPAAALLMGLLIVGLGYAIWVLATTRPGRPSTVPPYPISHVRPTGGRCEVCGRVVPLLHRYSDRPDEPARDVCDPCMKDLTGEPGLGGAA